MGKISYQLMLVLFLFMFAGNSFAAQSADPSINLSVAKKQKVLSQILGKQGASLQNQAEYVIGHGDVLTVSIFEEGDMAASSIAGVARGEKGSDQLRIPPIGIRVMMDGRISLKDIGDVEVVGLTLTQLANYLKKLYEVFYKDPIVTTTLVQSNSLRYTVMGEIRQPGVFFLDYPMRLVQVIARSGGFAEWAGKKVTVVREKIGENERALFKDNTLEFDYDDFLSGEELEKNVLIQSGDYIIVR